VAETSQLFARIAYASLKLGQFDQSLLRLEQGKAQLLAEALNQTERIISQLPDEYRWPIQTAREAIRHLEIEARSPADSPARRSQTEIGQALAQAHAALNEAMQNARRMASDLLPESLPLETILALPTPGNALILPLFSSQGSAILVIPPGLTTVTADNVIWLDEVKEDDLGELLVGPEENPGWLRAYSDFVNPQVRDEQAWFKTIEAISGRVWEAIAQPLHAHLQALKIKSLTIFPQGGLQLLPLHAAWRLEQGRKRYLLDDYVIHYAPSGRTLQNARQAQSLTGGKDGLSLLAISNPTGDPRLKYTPAEVGAIAGMFDPDKVVVLSEAEAKHEAVLRGQAGAAIFHFSGHGTYDWSDPQQSGLLCADKTLSLHTIQRQMDLSRTRLVCLSACETGVVDVRQSPDEFVGLSAGFMVAGAPAVLSSLWPVSDRSTMLLLERFYDNYLNQGLSLAASLQKAQQWLRTVTNQELAEYYEHLVDSLRGEAKITIAEAIDMATAHTFDPEARPYEPPFYWAAFMLTGI
jgi:CHAT domain-containing protein